jgi:hypothetical protein
MTIDVPPNLEGQVESFIAEVIGDETEPKEVAACRRIAVYALIQRGLRATHEMKTRKEPTT